VVNESAVRGSGYYSGDAKAGSISGDIGGGSWGAAIATGATVDLDRDGGSTRGENTWGCADGSSEEGED